MRFSLPLRSAPRLLLLALLAVASGCSDADPPTQPEVPLPEAPALSFVGTETCANCHGRIYATFRQSGHPYKLVKITDGKAPFFPFSGTPRPPLGFTWNDVSYTIGGYAWKTRFVDKRGYIITAGGNNQYNLNTGGWSSYEKDKVKKFDCGECHTTGYSPEGNQDGMPGMVGTWALPGVQCEACHGQGSRHAFDPRRFGMKVDRSTEACATCHNRNGATNPAITAQNGFLMHRDALHSIRNTPGHREFTCVTCHDPHAGSQFTSERGIQPTKLTCEGCHRRTRANMQLAPLYRVKANMACTTCHMPPMSVSGVPTKAPWVGDLKTHLVRINPDPAAPQFYDNGTRSYAYITLGFACLGCHENRDLAWAGQYARQIHVR